MTKTTSPSGGYPVSVARMHSVTYGIGSSAEFAKVRATSNLTATDVRRERENSTARTLFAPQGGTCVVCRGNA